MNKTNSLDKKAHVAQDDATDVGVMVEATVDDAQSKKVRSAQDKEHSMTLSRGLKAYPKAIGWSILLSAAVLMEGFDTVLIGSFFAFPSFLNSFSNTATSDGTIEITAPWQAALGNGAYIGEILGLQVTGWVCDKYGFRITMAIATTLMIGFIFISFFGMTLGAQLAGQISCGIPWGAYQTITTVYAAEVLPVALRGYLTSYVNICWVIGQFIASGVLVGFNTREDKLGWQIPYALQWIWPVPILIVIFFAPESPSWLVRQGRFSAAEHSLTRLQSAGAAGEDIPTPAETVAQLVETDNIEKELVHGTTYMECFRGTNLRRTEIATMTWVIQQMCGPVLQTYATYFFLQAGLETSQAFSMTLGLYALAFVGTCLSWPLINKFGRRTIFLSGLVAIFFCLMLVGLIGIAPASSLSASWAIGAFLLIFTFIYDFTVGPLTYVIVPEIPSSRLRTKTTVIARNAYNITCIWSGILTPYMLNPTSWNWGAKAALFWAGITLLCIVYVYFRLPETKGFTFAEIDRLFEQGVSARDFTKHRGQITVTTHHHMKKVQSAESARE